MTKFPSESVFRIDHGTEEAFTKEGYLEAKRREAIAYLGSRWVLHPDNRVVRLEKPRRYFLWQEAA